MKNKNLYTFLAINKISKVLLILMCCAFFSPLSNAANNNLILAGCKYAYPNPNDTVYPLQLILMAYEYGNTFNVSCFGFKDGRIDLTVNGGTPPFTYQWSEGDTIKNIKDLPAGYYKVIVTDADSSIAVADITLTQPTPLKKLETEIIISKYPNNYNVSCINCFNGSLSVAVTGGSGEYIYAWKDDSLATLNRSGLGAGIYFITIKDTNKCSGGDGVQQNIPLSEPPNNGWSMNGNANINANQFIGTTDGNALLFKTNSIEQMRLTPSDSDSTSGKVTVEGNIFSNGKIITNRITTLDSLLYIGDSSLTYNPVYNRIASDGMGYSIKGMGLGTLTIGKAINSIGLGYFSRTYGNNSIGIGNRVFTDVEGTNSIILGSGPSNNSGFIINNKPNTLMVGFNSTIPTLYVGSSNGTGTTGNVGIGTTEPQAKLQINIDDNTEAFTIFNTVDNDYNFKIKGNGYVYAREITVKLGTLGDFVFAQNYKLITLDALEEFINKNSHLPGIPSATDVNNNGLNVGEFQNLLLQKIEELTLYILELNKKNEILQKKMEQIEKTKTKK